MPDLTFLTSSDRDLPPISITHRHSHTVHLVTANYAILFFLFF